MGVKKLFQTLRVKDLFFVQIILGWEKDIISGILSWT